MRTITNINNQSKTCAYDLNGNITDINTRILTYNQDNRLTRVQEGSTVLGEYTYNGLGQRVKKVAGTTTTIFHYDFDGNIIGESSLTGTFAKEYLYRSSNRLAMVDVSTGNVYLFGNDSLGTPQVLTNSTNTVVWEANYKPFGEAAVNQGSTVVNNFRYQGQYYDSETGLHYNYHRYYDPSTGRYLTPDPIGLSGGINLFAYAMNNPINEIDPLGLENKSIGKIKIGGKIYKFIPGDHHGVNPAEMHVHDRATGNKVGVETGNVYDPKGKKVIGKIKAKQLAKLKNVLRSTGYIASAVTILEIYDAMTAKNAKAFDNFLDTISILPPDLQEEALQNALKEKPELFEEIEEDLCE